MSTAIELLYATGHAKIDEIIRGAVELTELLVPGRVRAYHLLGSYANGSAITSSDLDIAVIFKGEMQPTDRAYLQQVYDCCWRMSSVSLDIVPYSEVDLQQRGVQWLLNSPLLYGANICDTIPQLPMTTYVRNFMHTPWRFFMRSRQQLDVITFPLDHPDPAGAWLGYDRRRTRALDGRDALGTHELITCTFWPASALILRQCGVFTHGKHDVVQQYRACIKDEWRDVLAALYQKCRIEWQYFIPDSAADQQLLRDLCQQALAFHNHFLRIYQDFLLTELQSDDADAQLLAAQRLGEILYPEQPVVDALNQLVPADNAALAAAIQTTLQRFDSVMD